VLLDGGSERIAIDVRLSPDEFPGIQRRSAIPCDGCGQGRKDAADSGSFLERHQLYFITSLCEAAKSPPPQSMTVRDSAADDRSRIRKNAGHREPTRYCGIA